MATANAKKNALALPIEAVAMPALMAGFGRVTSVNMFKLDAVLARNVRDLQEERRERPSIVNFITYRQIQFFARNTFQGVAISKQKSSHL